MKHQPFETWLFETLDLSLSQSKELEEHLSLCDRCSSLAAAWNEVEGRMRSTTYATPAPGFGKRWQAHLAQNRRVADQRQLGGVLVSLSFALVLLSLLLGVQLMPLLESVFPIIVVWFTKIVNVIAHYNLFWDILQGIGSIILEGIPLVFRVTLPFGIAGVLALWIVSLHRLNYQEI